MKKLSGGELVIECLRRHGITQFFAISGGQMATMFEAIGQARDLALFVPRNETVIPIMAAGYTAVSGVPAVSMATVGAGVVYEVAGLLKAWLDYVPMLSIAPQVQSYRTKPHQESLQACHQDELFFPITKWNTIVYHWERIPQLIDRAVREALAGIPGPVHLDIPVDVLFRRKRLSSKDESRILPPKDNTRYSGPLAGDRQQLDCAASALAKAERPLVIVGQGLGRPGRYPQMAQILNRLAVPVITTTASSGAMSGCDPCFVGHLSLFDGCGRGEDVIAGSDLLMIVGIDRYTRDFLALIEETNSHRTIVQIETDPAAFVVEDNLTYPVYADPMTALSRFEKECGGESRDFAPWQEEVTAFGEGLAADTLEGLGDFARSLVALSPLLSAKDILVADGGSCCHAAAALLEKAACRHLFLMDERDFAGAGLPFAIGALLADRESRVTLICDRKALFRHVRELQPIASAGLGLKIICLDEPDEKSNVVDLALVLKGLGCGVISGDREPDGLIQLFEGETGRPSVWIL